MKIALIDDPRCCYECPMYGLPNHYCWYSAKHTEEIDETKEVAEWCELRNAPEHRPDELWYGRHEHDINEGWNMCVDMVWGEGWEEV